MPKVNVLIEGPIGSGKTHSLRTLIDAGQELFVLATEPGITSVLGDLPDSQCHWAYIPPGSVDWETARSNAEKLNQYTTEQVIKMPGIDKHKYTQFLDVYSRLASFTCDRCGEDFGPVDSWPPSRTLALDGLTGLSTMAIQLVVGAKPIRSLPEWLGGQSVIRSLIGKLCHDTSCNFVLIAHTARERDEVTGQNLITVSTLGRALAPDIPIPFDEVIFARREKDKFFWSTVAPEVDQKVRILPWSDALEPSFVQIFERMGEMEKKAAAE